VSVFVAYVLIEYFGVQYILATTVGFLIQINVLFVANSRYVFARSKSNISELYIREHVAQVFVFLLVLVGTGLGVEVFALSYVVSRVASGIWAGIVGYLFDTYYTFR
jgi:putative flippase GtrA